MNSDSGSMRPTKSIHSFQWHSWIGKKTSIIERDFNEPFVIEIVQNIQLLPFKYLGGCAIGIWTQSTCCNSRAPKNNYLDNSLSILLCLGPKLHTSTHSIQNLNHMCCYKNSMISNYTVRMHPYSLFHFPPLVILQNFSIFRMLMQEIIYCSQITTFTHPSQYMWWQLCDRINNCQVF